MLQVYIVKPTILVENRYEFLALILALTQGA